MQQRDLAQSLLNDLLQAVVEDNSRQWASYSDMHSNNNDALSISDLSSIDYQNPCDYSSFDSPVQVNKLSYDELLDDQPSPGTTINNPALNELMLRRSKDDIIEEDCEEHCKEVRCVEIHALSDGRIDNPLTDKDTPEKFVPKFPGCVNFDEQGTDGFSKLVPTKRAMDSQKLLLTKSNSCLPSLMNNSMFSLPQDVEQDDKTTPKFLPRGVSGMPKGVQCRPNAYSDLIEESKSCGKPYISDMVNTADFGIVVSEDNYEKQVCADQEIRQNPLETIGNEEEQNDEGVDERLCLKRSPLEWQLEFQRKQEEIIQLWHTCHVSLVHRSCFFLLFKGDPTDAFYMEVECRRLSLLKNVFYHGNVGDIGTEDGHRLNLTSSMRYLQRERHRLSKLIGKTFYPQERESLYSKWGISLNSKQRRMQLSQLVWTKTDIAHVSESALLVAKLIGFVEQGEEAMKEMFGLGFTVQQTNKRSFSWIRW